MTSVDRQPTELRVLADTQPGQTSAGLTVVVCWQDKQIQFEAWNDEPEVVWTLLECAAGLQPVFEVGRSTAHSNIQSSLYITQHITSK